MKLVSGASSINQFLIWQLCDFTVYLVILLLRDASSKLIDVLFLLVWLYRYAFHSTNRMSDDEKPRPFFVPVAPLRIIIFGSEIPLEIWGESTRWVFLFFRQEYPFSTADGNPWDQLQRVLCFSKNFCWYKLLNNKKSDRDCGFLDPMFHTCFDWPQQWTHLGLSQRVFLCLNIWITILYLTFRKNIGKWTRS